MTQKENYFEIVHRYFGNGDQWKKDPFLFIDNVEFDDFINEVNNLLGLGVTKKELLQLSRISNEAYTFEKLYDFFDTYKSGISAVTLKEEVSDIGIIEKTSSALNDSENETPIVQSQSLAYNYMLKGQYDEAVSILQNDNQNVELRNFINSINYDLQENKQHAEEIKNRNFFQRIISSNIKDIGNVLFEQNISLSAFFVFLRLLSLSSEANRKLLLNLYDYADKESQATGNAQSSIQKGIIAVLKKNEEEFKQNELRDQALMKLLKEAQANEDFKSKLSQLVSQAQQEYSDAVQKIHEQYDSKINSIEDQVKSMEEHVNTFETAIKNVYAKNEVDRKLKNFWIAYGITTATLLAGLIASFLI